METNPAAAMTRHMLVCAGIEPGMRVLDVGCGLGKVSAMVSRLVGDRGSVVGIDRESKVLDEARGQELDNAEFIEGDFTTLPDGLGLFDAAVGRRVLMYQRDPTSAIRALARAVRPGGVIAFEELDGTTILSPVRLPLHEKVRGWLWTALEREGVHLNMGARLFEVFEAAGLTDIEVRAETVVHTPNTNHPTAQIIRYMIPRMARQGVATEAEVEIDSLETRLRDELENCGSVWLGDLVYGAWARVAAP